MMKKFLILMFVLVITSSAHAALMLSIEGDTDLEAAIISICTSIEIGIHSDDSTPYGAWLSLSSAECGDLVDETMTIYPAAGQDAEATPYGEAYAAYGYHDLWNLSAASFNPELPVQPGVHFEIDYHCLGCPGEWVTITLYANDLATVLDTVLVGVPEPMTFALVGVGGLLLRRRR
jgi:hypothetical protein